MTRYFQPFGNSDPNAEYVNGDAQLGRKGSIWDVRATEQDQREIVNAIIDAGITPSENDVTQLAQAIRRSTFIYVVDQGTANSMVLNPQKIITSYTAGLQFEVKVAANCTGATTANVSGLGPRSVVREDGSPLGAGDVVAGGIALIVYDGINFQLLTPASLFISQNSLVHYGVDTGSTDALVATVTPAVTSLSAGLLCLIACANTNTGASTINISNLGIKNIVRASGASLSAGDLIVGALAEIAYDGTNWELLNVQVTPSVPGAVTEPLRPYWIAVNSATVSAPPSSPALGDTYRIPPGATGAWSGLDHQVTQWTGTDGWHTRDFPIQSLIGIGDQDDIWKRTATGWRSIWATIDEAAAGVSTTIGVTPACLRRASSIVGPLWPYFVTVKSQTVTSPPVSPTLGDVYCVPSGATGAWSGLDNDLVQWDGNQWLSRSFPTDTMIGVTDTDDWQVRRGGGGQWRTAYATLAEALEGTSTTLIINPADLAYVLAHQPGSGDDLLSNLLWYGCL